MSGCDQFILDESIEAGEKPFKFVYKNEQYVSVNDINNGSYQSGQVTFDLNTFANANKFFNAKNSYLLIPLAITVTGAPNMFRSDAQAAFIVSLKNGYHQLINSMSISLCNNEVIQIQSFQNCYINYKLLTELSPDDLCSMGQTLNFVPDGFLGAGYDDVQGSVNNYITGTGVLDSFNLNVGYSGLGNSGRLARMRNTSFAAPTVAAQYGIDANTLQGTNSTIYKNQFIVENPNTQYTYHILATIPLTILSDFFDKLPLIKNGYFKMTINCNTQIKLTQTFAGDTNGVYATCPVTSIYNTCPLMLSPVTTVADPNLGCNVVADSTTYTVQMGIANSGVAGTASHPLTVCQIVGSLVELTPSNESLYNWYRCN